MLSWQISTTDLTNKPSFVTGAAVKAAPVFVFYNCSTWNNLKFGPGWQVVKMQNVPRGTFCGFVVKMTYIILGLNDRMTYIIGNQIYKE